VPEVEPPLVGEVETLTPEEIKEVVEAAPVEEEVVAETIEEVPEVEPTLEELFTLRPEVLDTTGLTDEDEMDELGKPKKKGKKKGKHVVVTYDPDRDMTVVQKKHKRGSDDWNWEE